MKKCSLWAQHVIPALPALSFAVISTAHAQAIEISPMVISASRMEQPLSEVLSSVSVIGRADIDKSQAMTLADLLQGEAGFEFGRNGGPGGTTSFFLRGQDSTNTVVLIDGVKAQTDKIGAIQITDFPLQQIERIEVLKGNAGALYGNAAIGGVINVVTRKSLGEPKAYGSFSAGSYRTTGAFAGYGGTVDDISFDLNLGRNRSAGFSAMNTAQKTYANPDKDSHQNDYASARFEKRISPDIQIGGRLNHSVQDVGYDSGYSWQDVPADTHRFKKTNESASGYVNQALSADWQSKLTVARSEYTYEDTRNGAAWPSNGYTNSLFKGSQNALSWNNSYQVRPETKAVFGADVSEDKFIGTGSQLAYALSRRNRGLYAGLNNHIGRMNLAINVRHERYHLQQENSTTKADYEANTGLVGLGYQVTPAWRLTGTFSSGFSAPTADALSSNPNIRPERHQSQEAGAVYQVRDALLRMVYFKSKATDAIIYDNNYTYINGNIDNEGLEFSGRANVDGFSIKSSVTLQDPRDVTQNLPQARRAKRYGSLDISRSLLGYEAGVKVYAAGARPDSNFNPGVSLPGYAVWSFYASRKIDDHWIARVRLENAFDKQYQLADGYNTPGRGLYVTLQYSPKQ